jgi:hypothetical protein
MPFGHSIREAYARGHQIMRQALNERAAMCPNCRRRPPRPLDAFDEKFYASMIGASYVRDLCSPCNESGRLRVANLCDFIQRLQTATVAVCDQTLRDELGGERRPNYIEQIRLRQQSIRREQNRLAKTAAAKGT